MDHLLPSPAIIAHRGASVYAPENTLAAFELAVRQNADAIELDAKLSVDGCVVVIHDQTVDRTTTGSGKVDQLSLPALKEFDAGKPFDPSFAGETIPTLDEVFEAVGRKIFINVELTNYQSPRDPLAEKVAEIVLRHNLEDYLLFSSFNPIVLRRIHRILPQVPLGLLTIPGLSGAWARSFLGRWVPYQALHPELKDTSKSLIQNCHHRGHRLHTYTVNQPQDMRRLFSWGVDGIFTDDPLLAQRTLAEFKQENPPTT